MPDLPHRIENGSSAPIEAEMPRSRMGRRLLCSIATLGGIALSLIFFSLLLARERQLTEEQFHQDSKERIGAIRQGLTDRLGAVDSLAALFLGSQLVESTEFSSFNEWLYEKHQSILILGWAPHIPDARRNAHQQAVRERGFSNYEISDRDPQGKLVAAGKREDYYPILFVKPNQENPSWCGLDLEHDPAFGKILKQAIASGRPVASVGPALDSKSDSQRLYIVEAAQNEKSNPANRPADQPENNGLVLGVFNLEAIVETSLSMFPQVGIDIFLLDPSNENGEKPIYTRLSSLHKGSDKSDLETAEPDLSSAMLRHSEPVDVANGVWSVVCVPTKIYCAREKTWVPVGTLLAGLLVTGLFTGWLAMLTGRTATVEKMVTKRTRELYESEQRFRRLVDNAGDAFFLHDADGKILDVSKRACQSLGYTREELLAMTIADIDVHYISLNLMKHSKHPTEEYPVSFEGVHRRKDGTTFPVEIRLALLIVGEKRLMLSLARDITDRKRAEEALHDEQRLLRDMLDLLEQDRKLVAYEIHDGLAQQLTAAIYKFQAVELQKDSDPAAARKLFDESIGLLREALAETRRLISGLRPEILDELGVVAAIDSLIAEHRKRGGPEIEFSHPAEFERLAPPLESAAFRIVQECLTNACRYSQSPKVLVELQTAHERVQIHVQDWGIGFDPARIGTGHFGLRGIRERARLLGGAASIQSELGQGTQIHIVLPLLPPVEKDKGSEE
jgi:PAS domain S-box-containing protein